VNDQDLPEDGANAMATSRGTGAAAHAAADNDEMAYDECPAAVSDGIADEDLLESAFDDGDDMEDESDDDVDDDAMSLKNKMEQLFEDDPLMEELNELDVLSLEEAAVYLKIDFGDVRRMIKEQGLPGRKIGDEWRFLRGAIADWLRAPGGSTTPAVQEKPAREERPARAERPAFEERPQREASHLVRVLRFAAKTNSVAVPSPEVIRVEQGRGAIRLRAVVAMKAISRNSRRKANISRLASDLRSVRIRVVRLPVVDSGEPREELLKVARVRRVAVASRVAQRNRNEKHWATSVSNVWIAADSVAIRVVTPSNLAVRAPDAPRVRDTCCFVG
jgi:excisionase family DNA binding protein